VTAGTANVPTVVSVTNGTADVPTEVDVTPGTANTPTAVTLPTLTTTLNGTTLELGWSAGSVTPGVACVPTAVSVTPGVAGTPTAVAVTPGVAGAPTQVTLPTSKSTSVVTGVAAELHNAPVFSGTQATIVSE
jgi:mRNA-degrading endonuclease toxin of MazEF toxin-antitoxin module